MLKRLVPEFLLAWRAVGASKPLCSSGYRERVTDVLNCGVGCCLMFCKRTCGCGSALRLCWECTGVLIMFGKCYCLVGNGCVGCAESSREGGEGQSAARCRVSVWETGGCGYSDGKQQQLSGRSASGCTVSTPLLRTGREGSKCILWGFSLGQCLSSCSALTCSIWSEKTYSAEQRREFLPFAPSVSAAAPVWPTGLGSQVLPLCTLLSATSSS